MTSTNLKTIAKVIQNVRISIDRFDKHQKEKLDDSDDFIKYESKKSNEILEKLDDFLLISKKAIRSIDVADNSIFTGRLNIFLKYLRAKNLNEETFEELKIALMDEYRTQYAIDTKQFGSIFLKEGHTLYQFLEKMIGFLDTMSREMKIED